MNSREKQLKDEYLATATRMGVFQIRNTESGKSLVLSSTNLQGLINRHRFQLEKGGHPNRDLQSDWNRLGAAAFAFEILDELSPVEDPNRDYGAELKILEGFWAENEGAYAPNGYTAIPKDRETRLRDIAAARLRRERDDQDEQ